ncbi:thermonuclease family protein [Nonomuraea sp. NPDC050643]|uniref:thermonuclease family protein n=1 Tax=Nonomuraea sp. NPDC050643 TaxID=3155660 RepID=UPI0033E36B5C
MRLRPRTIGAVAAVVAVLPITVAAPAEAAAPSGVPKGAVSARLVKIVDGDTIDVMRGGRKIRVRLLEVDTPERGQCWFTTATARTAALLPVGKVVYLLPDKDPKDPYGRWLFYVFNAKGVHVNRNLVRYGYGKAVLYKPNDRYIKTMRAEQAKAKADRLRIWSGKCDGGGSTPNPTPTPTSSSTPNNPPSGNDPRYKTCAEANAAGYGPYRRDVDPEYAWYQDRDGDGIVCER